MKEQIIQELEALIAKWKQEASESYDESDYRAIMCCIEELEQKVAAIKALN